MEPDDIDFDNQDRAAVRKAIDALHERHFPSNEFRDSLGNTFITTCRHMRTSWFNPDLPDPDTSTLPGSVCMSDQIHEAAIPASHRTAVLGILNGHIHDRDGNEQAAGGLRNIPQTFHRFPDLPGELRQQIWSAALPARIHDFYSMYAFSEKISRALGPINARLQVPLLASVCREARDVVFHHTRALQGLRCGSTQSRTELGTGPGLGYATDRDTLDFGYAGLKYFRNFPQDLAEFRKFRFFAFDPNQAARKFITHADRVAECSELFPLLSLSGQLEAEGVSVVMQTIHVILKDRDSIAPDFPVPPGRDVREIAVEITPFWLGAPHVVYERARPEMSYMTHIIGLHDRRGLQHVFNLWPEAMEEQALERNPLATWCSRFDAAFCMDCLLLWWENRDKRWVQYLFLYGMWAKEKDSPDCPTEEDVFPSRWQWDFEERHPWILSKLKEIPPLRPAVRFKIFFPNRPLIQAT